MLIQELSELGAKAHETKENAPLEFALVEGRDIKVYPRSVRNLENTLFLIANVDKVKSLVLLTEDNKSEVYTAFDGEEVYNDSAKLYVKVAPLTIANSEAIQKYFEFTKPILLGLTNSFGFGDRIGFSNAAHLRSCEKSEFKPILAQQSIRELTRTMRTPGEVMAAAVWGVFQEGYTGGFGADADHLKTTEDIDLMINAGYTMFTFDPGENVINEADSITVDELNSKLPSLNWEVLQDTSDSFIKRYSGKTFNVADDFTITPDDEAVLRATVKYGNAVAHIKSLYDHLANNYSDKPYEIEISVDETESVTTPFEHFFIANELNRLGVKLVSLAPRFIGDFEKGIDYKGDLDVFKTEYVKHLKITEYFGSYKISLHSGSDKFGVYRVIGSLRRGYTHIKTAGTSYLEAIKVVASAEPALFRTILDFARDLYEKEKMTYHVSASLDHVKKANDYTDEELVGLFTQDDARQVLHVTFGKVLTTKKENGEFLFKTDILECLKANEDLHYKYLINHFDNHLNPFK